MRKSVNSLSVPRKKGAYSQVLKVGDFVFISGQVGLNKDLSISESLIDQVKTIFNNTNLLLEELKMHINQVVRTVIYVVEGVDMEVVDKIYEAQFKHPLPARSVIFVSRLEVEAAKIEISFDAIDLSAYEAMQGCSGDGCDGCEDEDCEHN